LNWLYEKFLERVVGRSKKQNKNWLCIIVGGTGSGKTYAGLRLCEDATQGTFDGSTIVFDHHSFINLIHKEKLPPGSFILFDEAGVGMSSKEWYSIQNKIMRYVLETFRRYNYNVIFTVPTISFIDKQIRTLFHTYMETSSDGIDYRNNINYVRTYQYIYDNFKEKIITPFYRFRDKDNRSVVMKKVALKMPSRSLIEKYEKMKKDYTEKLYGDLMKEMEFSQRKKKPSKGKACPVCSTAGWVYHKKTVSWTCRKCGYELYKNPFK